MSQRKSESIEMCQRSEFCRLVLCFYLYFLITNIIFLLLFMITSTFKGMECRYLFFPSPSRHKNSTFHHWHLDLENVELVHVNFFYNCTILTIKTKPMVTTLLPHEGLGG